MYILDTDHLTILERSVTKATPLLMRMANINNDEIATTIISYEEQMRGWLSYIAKTNSLKVQVEAYNRLLRQLEYYCSIPIVEFQVYRQKIGQPNIGQFGVVSLFK